MKSKVFLSDDTDSVEAVNDIIGEIESNFKDAPDALIVEASIDHDHKKVLAALTKKYPNAAIVGGSTDGEISDGKYHTDTLAVCAIHVGKEGKIKSYCLPNVTNDTLDKKMSDAVTKINADMGNDIKFALTWVEGLPGFDPGPSPKAFYKHLGKTVPIYGGSTGDYARMKGTKQFFNDQVLDQSIIYLAFGGDFTFSSSIDSGWNPIGDQQTITKAEGNLLIEINNRPATEVIAEFTGSNENLCKNPFAVYEDDGQNYSVLSGIMVTEQGYIMMAGTVPVGKKFRFTEITTDRLVEAAESAISDLKSSTGSTPSCLFMFSCSARRQLLGTAVDREIAPLKEKFPGVPMIGQYCYGEFGPYRTKQESRMHNNTCIVVAVSGKKAA